MVASPGAAWVATHPLSGTQIPSGASNTEILIFGVSCILILILGTIFLSWIVWNTRRKI